MTMLRNLKRFFSDPVPENLVLLSVVRLSFTARYTMAGVFFGLLFPLLAMAMLLIAHRMPPRMANLIEIQLHTPLLWIIDTAPLFLGMFASFAGRREDRLRWANARLLRERLETVQLQQLTKELEQRTDQLKASVDISGHVSRVLDLDELLAETVNQIQAGFGYYHTQIYLLDENEEKLITAAGTGQAGEALRRRGHSISLAAQTSLVARAARTNRVVRVDNVRESPEWLPNPLLPKTMAELAVPLSLGGENQILGVLDVQSDKVAGLGDNDVSLMRSLANQVAVAVRNARLFVEMGTALEEARRLQARYTARAWDWTTIQRQKHGRALFGAADLSGLNESLVAEARRRAPNYARLTAFSTASETSAASTVFAAPIRFRGQTIGNLQLHGVKPDRVWTEDELALVDRVLDQVAETAENLRLFKQVREQASREKLISQISDKLRRAPDIATLMKVAVEELSKALGATRTFVRLDDDRELHDASLALREVPAQVASGNED
jgi:GAF domain-containing protein